MSPSWHNRLYVAISPERISMIKLGRGLKPALQAKHDEVIVPIDKQPVWQAVSDRFTQLLSQPEWQKAEVNVVLSNRLVRFSISTFDAKLKQYSAQEAFAKHALTQTFGPVVDQWELRIQPNKAGTPSLVSAIDQTLLNGLQQACATSHMKLNRVTPYLTPVFNRFQKQITHDPAWLVIRESAHSLLVLLSKGELIAINGVDHSDLDELPILLDRENLVNSLPEACKSVYLYAPANSDFITTHKAGYEFHRLDLSVPEGFPASSDGLYAMIMSEFV